MQPPKSTPDPRGLSCLTCRQRRKKCDRVRPVCERCTKGNFQCLGYDNEEPESDTTSNSGGVDVEMRGPAKTLSTGTRTRLRPILPRILPQTAVEIAPNDVTPSDTSVGTPEMETQSDSFVSLDPLGLQDDPGYSIFGAGLLYQVQLAPKSGSEEVSTLDSLRAQYDELWPQGQTRSLTRRPSPVIPAASVREWPPLSAPVTTVAKDIGIVMKIVQRSIPRSVNANAQMRESYFAFLLTEYELQRMRNYFRPPPTKLRQNLVLRAKRSETTLSFLYLGAKIFQALTDKSQGVTAPSFVHWMDKVDHQVTGDPPSNPPIDEVEDRLTGLLELVYLKSIIVGTVAGYLLLARTLPTFLQVVSTNPDLWSERRGLLRISLPRALRATRQEVRRFVYYDTMCALTLGVPPLGEYDSSDFPIVPEGAQPLEWAHGVPVELFVNIAQVHTWRASHPGVPNQEDWPILELRTNAWKPRTADLGSSDSSEAVARMAVQESWRHTTLIYVYMGMCGLSSHDPRVQFSVRQLIQIIGLVTETPIDIHFSVPCVIAGLAARYEKQRAFVRNKLHSFQGTRVWILRGADFCSVLDHLWHGVAANGGAVTWEDYVNSRCIRLPII